MFWVSLNEFLDETKHRQREIAWADYTYMFHSFAVKAVGGETYSVTGLTAHVILRSQDFVGMDITLTSTGCCVLDFTIGHPTSLVKKIPRSDKAAYCIHPPFPHRVFSSAKLGPSCSKLSPSRQIVENVKKKDKDYFSMIITHGFGEIVSRVERESMLRFRWW